MFQGEPLPAALVELVRNSPISSIEDLQLLLLTDSVGKDHSDITVYTYAGTRLTIGGVIMDPYTVTFCPCPYFNFNNILNTHVNRTIFNVITKWS